MNEQIKYQPGQKVKYKIAHDWRYGVINSVHITYGVGTQYEFRWIDDTGCHDLWTSAEFLEEA